MCTDLRELIMEIQAKRVHYSSVDARNMPFSLKLVSDRGCQLTDNECTTLAKQLRESGGPGKIPICEANLFV